ncbi:MAG: reverse transcriptase/maturase family protein [Thermodesulfobacteriota bacterium]|nr:reverse transcriptase/maturase family protein [Thermodesulfobacteriota bacterium]
MKRAGNLYLRIAEPDNLRLAFHKACRGKCDRCEVVQYRQQLNGNLALLRQQLLDQSLSVGDYRFFEVFDPKQRQICAAAFRERVLHHAIMNICDPVLDRYAIFDSYACRLDKGQRKAISRAQEFSRRDSWYLKLDIRKYFDSIDHEKLLELLQRRIKDQRLLALFVKIVESYSTAPGKGLPIGNLVSQHLANYYLGRLDHWIKDDLGVRGYLRYMDDFLLFGTTRQELKLRLGQITMFLAEELRLDLKENIQLNRCRLGIPFLGYRIAPANVRLTRRSGDRFRDKLQLYEARYLDGNWDEQQLVNHVQPLVEFTRFANSSGLRRQIIEASGVAL